MKIDEIDVRFLISTGIITFGVQQRYGIIQYNCNLFK